MTLPDTDPSLFSSESLVIFQEGDAVDIIADIYDMHEKFGVHPIIEGFDNAKLLAWLEFRLDFLQEELNEARSALSTLRDMQTSELPIEAAQEKAIKAADDVVDSMIDLMVVATGTLDGIQCDTDEAWARVHHANMQKESGIKPERPNPLGLPDLIKPPGWTAPTHEDNIGLLVKLVPGYEPPTEEQA